MFPGSEASLVYSVLTLSNFFISNFPSISWFPNWYLGNPYYYLIGPVVPVLLNLLSVLGMGDLLIGYFGVILISLFIGGAGVYLLLREFGYKFAGAIAGVLYIVMPFGWIGLYYQTGLKNVAFALIPFAFLFFKRLFGGVDRGGEKRGLRMVWCYLLMILIIVLALLTTVNVLLAIAIGFTALFLSIDRSLKAKKTTKWLWSFREEVLFKLFVILVVGVSLSTLWYTPGFWWVKLANPSFGGLPLWNLIVSLFQYALYFLPLVLAIMVVKWKFLFGRNRSVYLFGFLYFISFLILTLVRFLADPDFVVDWIGFIPELQFGVSVLGGLFFVWFYKKFVRKKGEKVNNHNYFLRYKKSYFWSLFLGFLGLMFFLSGYFVYGLFFYSISEYKSDLINIFNSHLIREDRNIFSKSRIFLSGSDVFWLNYYLPISQVRGGNDSASVNPLWAHGSYQIREGESDDLTEGWMRIFGTEYMLLHGDNTRDPFNDFKHIEKYEKWGVIGESCTDDLLKFDNASIARIADKKILMVSRPDNGGDAKTNNSYLRNFRNSINFQYIRNDMFRVAGDLRKDQVVSVSVSYDPGWTLEMGRGKVVGDSFGNIVIIPERGGRQVFVLKYERDYWFWVFPLVMSVLGGVAIWKYTVIYSWLKKRLPKFNFGLHEEDEY